MPTRQENIDAALTTYVGEHRQWLTVGVGAPTYVGRQLEAAGDRVPLSNTEIITINTDFTDLVNAAGPTFTGRECGWEPIT